MVVFQQHSNGLGWIRTLLLAGATFRLEAAAQSAGPFPATVEVDLIFPRNETFAPIERTPIVFAVQNPRRSAGLDLSVFYTIYRLGANGSEEGEGHNNIIHFPPDNFSNIDPFFVYSATTLFNNTEFSEWSMIWEMRWGNCSLNSPTYGTVSPATGAGGRRARIRFTTRNGAPQPDLVAATAEGTCSSAAMQEHSYAFNITGELPLDSSAKEAYDGRNSCAVLSDTAPYPPPNRCAVKINATTASNISDTIAYNACRFFHPGSTCKSAATKRYGAEGALVWVTLATGLVSSLLVL